LNLPGKDKITIKRILLNGYIENFARILIPNQCINFKTILNFRLAFRNPAEVDKIPPHNYNESIVNSKERI
jgi:hypothetical protein